VPNDIPARQNSPELLRYVHASSQAYGLAKSLGGWQTSLILLAAILGPLIAAVEPEAAIVGAILAVVAALIDAMFLESAAERYQHLGARFQEVFDTELFQIPWNTHRAGAKPTPEETIELAEDFKKKATPELLKKKEDWYPVEVAPVPLEYGRLVCQRSSMQWDSSLRKYYVFFFFLAVAVLAVGALLYGVFKHLTFIQFVLAVLAPLVPAGIKLGREAKKHDKSAAASERARTLLEGYWKDAIAKNVPAAEMAEESRRLQDELFDRRKQSPTVPERLYAWRRESQEQQMKYGAQVMVDEVLTKLAAPTTAPGP
jgi:hypothetical protein